MKEQKSTHHMHSEISDSFNVEWTLRTKRKIESAMLVLAGRGFLYRHGDYKGFSLIDLESKEERWEYRTKDLVSDPIELGRWLVDQQGDAWIKICLETGEATAIAGLNRGDFFHFSHSEFGVFSTVAGKNDDSTGSASFHVEDGKVRRFENDAQFLSPWIGNGGRFLASGIKNEKSLYFTGMVCPETGALLKLGSKPFAKPEQVNSAFEKLSDAFFLSSGKGGKKIGMFSWDGEPMKEWNITELFGDVGEFLNGYVATDEDGIRVLVLSYFKQATGLGRMICIDLKNGGSVRWHLDVPFIVGDHRRSSWPAFVAGKMIKAFGHLGFVERQTDKWGDGANAARVISLKNGAIHPFFDRPVAEWLVPQGRGLFFGDCTKGYKMIAFGKFNE